MWCELDHWRGCGGSAQGCKIKKPTSVHSSRTFPRVMRNYSKRWIWFQTGWRQDAVRAGVNWPIFILSTKTGTKKPFFREQIKLKAIINNKNVLKLKKYVKDAWMDKLIIMYSIQYVCIIQGPACSWLSDWKSNNSWAMTMSPQSYKKCQEVATKQLGQTTKGVF